MYKLVAMLPNGKCKVSEYATAVEAREMYNVLLHGMRARWIEIYEVEKWSRERLNQHAQLEEECRKLGKE